MLTHGLKGIEPQSPETILAIARETTKLKHAARFISGLSPLRL
jgi:hypothetical protein